MRIIVAMLALATAALVGCSTMKQSVPSARAASSTASAAPDAPVATVQVVNPPVPVLLLASRPKEPSAYTSLQPFKKFKKGEGEGVAIEYKSRTKAQFIALLRDKQLAKQEMRVSCEVLVRQMAEVHGLPFEGCEGAAAAIGHDDNYAVASCRDDMFQKANRLTVTNPQGTAWGSWHRKCLPNERILVYKNQPIVSLTCLNVAIPVVVAPPPITPAPPPKPAVPVATGACPNGFTLVANAWDLKSLPDDIRKNAEGLIAAAESRDSQNATNAEAYKPDAVSRTLGGQLRREVKIRAPLTADIRVQLRDPQTLKVVEELGLLHLVDGIGSIQLTYGQHLKIVETLWPGKFISPVVSGAARRIWLFRYEWGNWCEMNVHGILP
ncbi:MAG: hypothetical protein WA058_02030 [Minisyncoccia bacterium]